MTDENPTELTEDELEAQRAEQLPDRQAMSIIAGPERPIPLDGLDSMDPPPLTE